MLADLHCGLRSFLPFPKVPYVAVEHVLASPRYLNGIYVPAGTTVKLMTCRNFGIIGLPAVINGKTVTNRLVRF